MERTILILVASWFAFNALVAGLLLTRRSRSRHALYRWVVGAPARTTAAVRSCPDRSL